MTAKRQKPLKTRILPYFMRGIGKTMEFSRETANDSPSPWGEGGDEG